ncbi:hypothetical protein [Rhizobium leguminosarum]|uniref:hypothetical protein n=1 Tax=Rhizobium leguminosarum TaxID=384 RepID=UPI001C953367|nr:hypothetical protein [Rhizobium leguminosarum]MBY5666849.1 hypothetical protein [Rhizobium leguminosarum]MBY5680470.1 hypothetical protein [Rhizobium leguminosarum]
MQRPTSTSVEEIEKLPRKFPDLSGKRGSLLVVHGANGNVKAHVRKRVGKDIIRGSQRFGLKCRNLSQEAVYSNEMTSPRLEIPRVVVDTMRIVSNNLRAHDVAAFWRLFAEARKSGINRDVHSIRLGDIVAYLGLNSIHRVKLALVRLSEASMTLRLNQEGARGLCSMRMIELLHDEDLAELRGHDQVFFRLPTALKLAVLHSADYAWVELNAMARFTSKFTFPLYMKLCLEAGKHEMHRKVPAMSRSEFRKFVGMPEKTQASVLDKTMQHVLDELLAIKGVQQRFPISVSFVTENEIEKLVITVGSSAKRVREAKPAWIAPEMAEKMIKTVYDMKPRDRQFYPSLTRFRQAATLIETDAYKVFSVWQTDLHAVRSYGEPIVGIPAVEFIDLVEHYGIEDVFDIWVNKRDVFDFGVVPEFEPVEQTAAIAVPSRTPKPTKALKQAVPEPWQPKPLTYDDAPLRLINVIQEAGDAPAEGDDAEIPF